jgi:PAS domain S-box-containing protein
MTQPHILIVDDDSALLQALPQALRLRIPDVSVDTSDSAAAALELIAAMDYDAIVSDIKMPGMDGLTLLGHIRRLWPDTPTLLITGHGEHELAIQALRAGAYDFIQKPINRDYFVTSLHRAIEIRQLRRQVEEQQRALERHTASLEQDVRERTCELHAANQAKDELILARDRALAETAVLAAQLGQRAGELNAIFEGIADGVYVCDVEGRIARVNTHGAELIGQPLEAALHQPIAEYRQPNDFRYLDGTPMPREEYPLNLALRGETRMNLRFMLRRADTGEDIQVRVSCAPIRNAQGEITGAVAVASDITDLYRLERQKDEFLSIASHELKTPLTTIKGLTQITLRHLREAGASEVRYLTRMDRAIARMEMLVNDLLDISRIESGKLALRVERSDLTALARQAVEEQVAATDREIALEAPDMPLEADVDVDRISQVLANLLSNALKYSPAECPVTLRVEQSGDEVIFCVRDQGGGIPRNQLEHIFDRFYRVPGIEVQNGSVVGLGLGLYISREIAERHGGRVWAESKVGKGSAFYVALPLVMRPSRLRVVPGPGASAHA